MKHTYILGLILAAFLATNCSKKSEIQNNDLIEWKLKGPVKTISETDYSNTGKYLTYLLFNEDGFVREQASFNPDGSLIRKWKYEYNNRNLKTKRLSYVVNDSLSEIMYFTYNEYDKPIVEKLLDAAGAIKTEIKYEYDARQNEIEKKFFDENAEIQGGIRFIYDAKNNVVEELHYDSVHNQNLKQKKTYNPEGLNAEVVFLTMNDSLLRRVTNKYMSDKQILETCFYDFKNELVSKTTYEYDKQSNIVSTLTYSAGDKSTTKHTFEYTYDKYKNWISRNEFLNGEPVDMIIRKIEYY